MSEYLIDYRSVVRLVLKLVGMAIVVYGLIMLASSAPMTFMAVFAEELPSHWLIYSSPPLITIGLGFLLWFFPAPVTNTLFRASSDEAEAGQGWARQLEVMGVSLLGLFLLFRSVSDLIYHLLTLRARGPQTFFDQGYSGFPAYMAATLIELVFALVLIFGARAIAGFLWRVRHGGLGVKP